jgi:hypothetical protein
MPMFLFCLLPTSDKSKPDVTTARFLVLQWKVMARGIGTLEQWFPIFLPCRTPWIHFLFKSTPWPLHSQTKVILNKSQKTIIKYNLSSNTMWNLSLNFTFRYKIDHINMNILISLKITIPPLHIFCWSTPYS